MKQCEPHRRRWLIVVSVMILGRSLACLAQVPATSPHADAVGVRGADPAAAAAALDDGGDAIADAAFRSGPAFPGSLSAQGDTVNVQQGVRDALEPNRPNPFGTTSAGTILTYAIGTETHVTLSIYDFFYRPVFTLVDEVQPAGRYAVPFTPPPAFSCGMYFYELKTDRGRELRRMLYVQ